MKYTATLTIIAIPPTPPTTPPTMAPVLLEEPEEGVGVGDTEGD
jgi:hypothetical protein